MLVRRCNSQLLQASSPTRKYATEHCQIRTRTRGCVQICDWLIAYQLCGRFVRSSFGWKEWQASYHSRNKHLLQFQFQTFFTLGLLHLINLKFSYFLDHIAMHSNILTRQLGTTTMVRTFSAPCQSEAALFTRQIDGLRCDPPLT
jgi:hypothetical protein